MIIIDLFDIDFHIFTVIKFLFNLGVRIKYILFSHHEWKEKEEETDSQKMMTMKTTAMNTRLWERKSNGRNERMDITFIYILYIIYTFQPYKNFI